MMLKLWMDYRPGLLNELLVYNAMLLLTGVHFPNKSDLVKASQFVPPNCQVATVFSFFFQKFIDFFEDNFY